MKYVVRFICFWGILFGMILVGNRVFAPKNNTKEAGMINYQRTGYLAEPDNTVDVVYLGNSILYTSISPMLIYEKYGYTGVNVSGNAKKIDSLYYMFLEILKTQNPKVLVLEPETLLYRNTYTQLFTGIKEQFPFLIYHDRWKRLKLNDFTDKIEYTNRDYNKGFYHINKVSGVKNFNYLDKKRLDSDIQGISEYYLDLIKKECDKRDIKLMVISVPVMTYTNERHDNIKKVMDKKGIFYLDLNYYNDQIKVDFTTDTKDKGKHLNYKGAYKVTNYFADYLHSLDILEDHRNDSKYSFWDEDLAKYKEIYNE